MDAAAGAIAAAAFSPPFLYCYDCVRSLEKRMIGGMTSQP